MKERGRGSCCGLFDGRRCRRGQKEKKSEHEQKHEHDERRRAPRLLRGPNHSGAQLLLLERTMARNASHAGTWYTENARELGDELDRWLRAAGSAKRSNARAVIAPSRVFLLGPSHHHFTRKCALSTTSVYKTPLGDLPIDLEDVAFLEKKPVPLYLESVYQELKATGRFEDMEISVDEAEHSMEMHLPYIAKVFQGCSVKVVPILVGALQPDSEAAYGRLLAKYIDDPSNFFSVSSDFCHWGSRFNYTYYEKKHGPIYKSIEALDQNGMSIIETGDPRAFRDYMQEYDNTICGQHPIGVFLNMLEHCNTRLQIKFLQYEQSSHCKSMRDSSVSYASAVATVAAS
ncbi:hypothetical protein AXG93_1864s1430 [Marchantia polymorpha subsp. ruderalis]|uniref:Protein MEMO1 n=1 Tax=Marchantia polymorpha subsp. ruderalis TaxID=1480154 RepID=A0A176WR62_MARPO|nr:hypothetical protein AXG93_1864s1430 [Marchantia polymorpha subsp. ruderalis]